MFFLYKPVQLVQSKKVLLKDRKFGQVFEENVIQEKGPHSNKADLYFINKKNKYIWDESIQMFRKLRNVDETLNQSDFHKMHGLSPSEVKERMKTFGINIIKISVPPVLHLIIHEVLCRQRLCSNFTLFHFAGTKSFLPISILHGDPLDPAMVLEIRCDYCRYDRHYSLRLCLGNTKGEGSIQTMNNIATLNITYTTLQSLAKSETEGHNEIRVQDQGCAE